MTTVHNPHDDSQSEFANNSHLFGSAAGKASSVATAILPRRSVLLDHAAERLCDAVDDQEVLHRALDEMIVTLRDVREATTETQWQEWREACRAHPITKLLHQDPFTRRAFEKPRGYAGDAELLDFIYGREELWPAPPASQLGHQIFEYTTRSPAPEGVRARRAFIAKMIDRLADERRFPDVLAIAAGHFREALLSAAVKRRRLGRTVALDADSVSLEHVDDEYGCFGVETVAANIRNLFTGRLDLGSFDLVYSTGLFDYLNKSSSRRLVTHMFNMLNSGGRLIVANFLPGVRDVGYMEIFMDWHLIFRTRQEMMDITMEIPQEQIQGIRVFAEENQNIIFLEVVRK